MKQKYILIDFFLMSYSIKKNDTLLIQQITKKKKKKFLMLGRGIIYT